MCILDLGKINLIQFFSIFSSVDPALLLSILSLFGK